MKSMPFNDFLVTGNRIICTWIIETKESREIDTIKLSKSCLPVQLLRSLCNSRFPGDNFLVLSKNSTIGLIDFKYEQNYFPIFDLSIKITNLRIHPLYPYLLFFLTPTDGVIVYDLEKYSLPKVAIPNSPFCNATIKKNNMYFTDGTDTLYAMQISKRNKDKLR